MSKVLVLTTVHPIDDPRIFYKEAKSISEFVDDLTFIVPNDSQKEFYKDDIKVIPIPKTKSRFKRVIGLQTKVFKIIKKQKFDLIHFHDPELILLAFLLKKYFGIKIIYDVHENVSASIDVREWIPKFFKRLVKFMFNIVEQNLIKSFDAIVIAEKSYEKTYGSEAIQILNYPKVERNEVFDLTKNFDEKLNFVYAGSITEVRGIWQVLGSFKKVSERHPNFELHLIGPFNSKGLEQNVLEFIDNFNLSSKIKLYGMIQLTDMYEILKECHIGYVLTKPLLHHAEKLPGKIFDYMTFGIPVVATDFKIYDDYLIKYELGIKVNYEDIEDISDSLLELVEDRSILQRMSDNARKLCVERWNWNNEEEKLHALYTNILNKY